MNPDSLPPSLADALADISFREADPAIRAQLIDDLIARHPEHAAALRAAMVPGADLRTLGPFTILGPLGEGGFGHVYRARQTTGVEREVALKVLRNDLDSRAILARFELERQVLASMNHDAIARFFEAGEADGRLWFSMELVDGQPLTTYCDDHALSIPDRLRLFLQICDGVQHAHGKGIVHRDLKPANVLVSHGERGHVAKIIDFGIARATDRQLSHSMQTMLGMVLGTPEYMAPEQCGGDPLQIDARTDVYGLGVMLYELVSGCLPFAAKELPRDDLLTVQKVLRQKEPPKPSTRIGTLGMESGNLAARRRVSTTTWRRAVRGDLDDIIGRAMEKDPARRYASVSDLAADVQRHLAREPIIARPPSRMYRLKKFVSRYRGQVAAGAAIGTTMVAGAVVSLVFAWQEQARADENSRLAREKGELARSESAAKDQFASKVREFDQLAGVVLYERAIENEKDLYPPWPHKIAAMEKWLVEDAGKLLAMRPEIERTVRDLEARALPATAEDIEKDRRAHPRFAEFEGMTKHVASLRRAQAIRAGTETLVEPPLSSEQQALDAKALNTLAWERVAPKAAERKVYGEEALGLAAARAAAAKAKGGPTEFQILDTLAWALVANGQDAAAKEASGRALDLAPEAEAAEYEGYQQAITTAIANAASDEQAAEQQLAKLTMAVSERRSLKFELESQRFLHATLAELLGRLSSLAEKEKANVDQRLSWAKQIQGLSLAHPNATHTWEAVRAAIAANAKYAGQSIELREQDITGLVPIGENPVTHLWEFYELRSAWDGKQDPRAIAIPAHEADGSIKVTGDTGIVFVLLPGGTFTMGAQKKDRDGPNYDPEARDDETPHPVSLAPFFLARHELTQGQWARLWTWDESLRQPSLYAAGATNYIGGKISLANPVEQVDWGMCDTLLSLHGLVLPTEAQWEYACRGGTTTAWNVAWPQLRTIANLASAEAKAQTNWTCESWLDGHICHAPVGSFAADAFGLYDVHGNVWEWCRDCYGDYGTESAGDGLRSGRRNANRCIRGGSFIHPAAYARSAYRGYNVPSMRNPYLGLRPARLITY